MKIQLIILITLTFSFILAKEKSNGKNKMKQFIGNLETTVLHASVPNDAYTLQHMAV
jgi:hypothetical protein